MGSIPPRCASGGSDVGPDPQYGPDAACPPDGGPVGVRPAGPTPPGQSNGFRVSSSAPPTSLVRFQAFSPTLLPSGDQSTLSTTSKARSATQLPTCDPAQPPTIAHAGPHSAPPAVAPATAPPAASPARTPDRMPRSVELRSPRFASSFCCSFHPSQAVIPAPTAPRALPAPPSVLPITLPFHSLKLALVFQNDSRMERSPGRRNSRFADGVCARSRCSPARRRPSSIAYVFWVSGSSARPRSPSAV